MAEEYERERGSCWAVALMLALALGLAWFIGDAFFDWGPNQNLSVETEDFESYQDVEEDLTEPTPIRAENAWLDAPSRVGEAVRARVTVPAIVSNRVGWIRPAGSEAPVLAFAPDGTLGEGDTFLMEGEVVRPASLLSERDLSLQERQALDKEMAVVLVIEMEKPVAPQAQELDILDVRLNPGAYRGHSIKGTATVEEVLSRGDVWLLEQDGNQMYGLLNEAEVPLPSGSTDLQGSRVRIKGQVLSTENQPGRIEITEFEPLGGQGEISRQPAYLFINEYEVVAR